MRILKCDICEKSFYSNEFENHNLKCKLKYCKDVIKNLTYQNEMLNEHKENAYEYILGATRDFENQLSVAQSQSQKLLNNYQYLDNLKNTQVETIKNQDIQIKQLQSQNAQALRENISNEQKLLYEYEQRSRKLISKYQDDVSKQERKYTEQIKTLTDEHTLAINKLVEDFASEKTSVQSRHELEISTKGTEYRNTISVLEKNADKLIWSNEEMKERFNISNAKLKRDLENLATANEVVQTELRQSKENHIKDINLLKNTKEGVIDDLNCQIEQQRINIKKLQSTTNNQTDIIKTLEKEKSDLQALYNIDTQRLTQDLWGVQREFKNFKISTDMKENEQTRNYTTKLADKTSQIEILTQTCKDYDRLKSGRDKAVEESRELKISYNTLYAKTTLLERELKELGKNFEKTNSKYNQIKHQSVNFVNQLTESKKIINHLKMKCQIQREAMGVMSSEVEVVEVVSEGDSRAEVKAVSE
jgi:hypothetical protein